MNNKYYLDNRNKLIEQLPDNSLLVLTAGKSKRKSADENYKFEVNHNFYYLTGLNEEGLILVIKKDVNTVITTIYINESDTLLAKWVGAYLTEKDIKSKSGIENIKYIKQFQDDFSLSLKTYDNLYFDFEDFNNKDLNSFNYQIIKKLNESYKLNDAYPLIVKLRLIKSKEEIKLLQKAIDITNMGILAILDKLKTGLYEYQLAALFEYSIKNQGAKDLAFPTIASTGKNATILHYTQNNALIKEGELILFDLGANYNFYNADISRTFPVNGHFSKRQKEIYNIVLKGQKKILKTIKPGLTLKELNNILIDFYFIELKKIGLIKNKEEVKEYYYHGACHHLGLDTHDVCFREWPIQEGNIITVEPGLYIEKEKIGIRIEDNVLVTKNGCRNLSKKIIKELTDIENYLQK